MPLNMTKSLFIAAAAALAFAGQAQAQAQTEPSVQAQPQANLSGNGLRADTTRQQAQQRADMMFQQLDANHDGVITRQEAEQAAAQMGGQGGGKRFAGVIDRLFGQSQSVSQAQFQGQALSRFDRQDLNHDGVVTADERQQARANRSQGN
jgi:phage/plasmid-associated DNA primase